jgi:phospholipid/cholesterol/gamma-HCH transport system substrate-binding protein
MKANSVTVSGLNIGQVSDIYFNGNNTDQVIVEFAVSGDIQIPSNSTARIYSSDLLGTRGIEILMGNSKDLAEHGDTLQSAIQMSIQEEVSDMVQPIMRKAGNMMSSVDSVITAIGDVFNMKTRENLIRSVESLKNTIANIESSTTTIDTLITSQKGRLSNILFNIESISSNLRENNDNLTRIIANTAQITDTIAKAKLSQTMNSLNKSIEDLSFATSKISKGEGSLGLLISDDKLYNELESSSRELNLLLEDIRLNPKRYVSFSIFGGSNKKTTDTTTVRR